MMMPPPDAADGRKYLLCDGLEAMAPGIKTQMPSGALREKAPKRRRWRGIFPKPLVALCHTACPGDHYLGEQLGV
jgi:hypothetical protein